LLLPLLIGAASAQTTTPVTLSFSGAGSVDTGSASGTLAPFGTATVGITGTGVGSQSITVAFDFRFNNGDTLKASGPATVGQTVVSGNANVTGGTGAFVSATGAFSFTFTIDLSTDPNPFTLTGSGSVTTGAGGATGPQVCEGGSGSTLPVLVDSSCKVIACDGSGSTLPVDRKGPPPDSANPADTPAISGDVCSLLTFEGGGSTSPVLVFESGVEGSGGTLPVLVFDVACCGGSTGTLPVLVFDGGGSTLPVLAFDGSGGTLPVDRPCTDCEASAPATNSGTSIEIVTPLQSAAATYTAVASCPDSPANCWLRIPAASGAIKASSSAAITAIANPQGLKPGVYFADVEVTMAPSGAQTPLPILKLRVTLAATAAGPALALSQTGLVFRAVSGVGAPPPQSISISNSGQGSLQFTAVASTVSGGNWLAVSPASATAPSQVSIQTNPAGLAPGTYAGRVDFSGPGVVNSPQSVVVMLTVPASTDAPGPAISTAGLIFVSSGNNPAPQMVQVTNPSNQALTISTKLAFAQGNNWFSVAASTQPLTETVSVNAAGLASGVYVGTLDIHIAETNTDYPVEIMLVVPKAGASCTPTQLLPVFTNLEGAFPRPAGFPVPLDVEVVDDCGSLLTAGTVVAYLDNGDPALSLISIGQGHWAGTWLPHAIAGGPVTVGVMATSSERALYGSVGVVGAVTANKTVPLVNLAGVVSAASLAHGPIAPGSFLSIFGSNLASQPAGATSLPFPTTLGSTRLFLGGEPLPLQVAVNGQINAVVPYDVPVGATQQLIVQQNGIYSLPETVVIAESQPAVFTQDQSGKGAGVITVVKPDGTQFNNTPTKPASAGDALVIYCTGLGAVMPAVPAGSAAPASPPATTVNPVTVTIGGQSAHVLFSGLAPGFAGLYQVDVRVPKGITPGPNVPLVLSISGASSPPVAVAIQ
ncbi:MAG TPA: hypothetical protein VGZ73_15130, partial [Bryobacteraceae bacterium]|nr:hypothetical protein [Bryobacteraceae bacterium]